MFRNLRVIRQRHTDRFAIQHSAINRLASSLIEKFRILAFALFLLSPKDAAINGIDQHVSRHRIGFVTRKNHNVIKHQAGFRLLAFTGPMLAYQTALQDFPRAAAIRNLNGLVHRNFGGLRQLVSSLHSTPMCSAPSSSATLALSSRSGQAG